MYLYLFFGENGLIKLGKTEKVATRLSQVRAASPIPVQCLLSVKYDESEIDLERTLHSLFPKKRVRGEWFALSYDDMQGLMAIIRELFVADQGEERYTNLVNLIKRFDNWGWFDFASYELRRATKTAVLYRAEAFNGDGLELTMETEIENLFSSEG